MQPKFPLLFAALIAAPLFAAQGEPVTIKTLPAQMRYDLTEFTVAPGAEVRIIFDNADDLPHNVVFFQDGTDVAAVAAKNLEKPEEALKRDWLPDDPRILAHSKMVGPKSREEFVFKAPEKTGAYPYACTFPGHTAAMQGRMTVAKPGPGLTGLSFALYLGDWQKLPDFDSLTAHRKGPIADNLLQLKFDDYKNQFGAVFTGKLAAPKDGEYTFYLASDDGGRLLIDGKKVIEHDNVHAAEVREAKVKLTAGEHDFRFDYFQGGGEAQIFAAWKGADFSVTPLSKWMPEDFKGGPKRKKKDNLPSIPLVVEKEPVLYRNFVANGGGRSIAVGYPGGFNLTWSASQLNLTLIWRGAFLDAGRHWTDRGGGPQPPMGYDVLQPVREVGPPFAVLASAEDPWPLSKKDGESELRSEGCKWKGYTLDAKRFPTFLYEWNGVKISDRFDVEGDAGANGRLVRTLQLSGSIPANAYLRVASGQIQPQGGGFSVDARPFQIDGNSNENKFTVAAEGAVAAKGNLLVPAKATMKITYSWPALPSKAAR